MESKGTDRGWAGREDQDNEVRSSSHASEAITLREFLFVLSRHRWTSIVFALAVLTVAVYIIRSSPPVYESEAKLLVSGAASVGVELLRSRGFADDVVRRLGPETILGRNKASSTNSSYPTPIEDGTASGTATTDRRSQRASPPSGSTEEATARFMKALEVRNEATSNVITLAYDGRTPSEAQRILREVVEVYVQKTVELSMNPASLELLSVQTDRAKSRLEDVKAALSDFRNRYHVTQFEAQQKMLLQRIDSLRSQIQEAQVDYSGAEAAVATSHDKLGFWKSEQEQRVRMGSLKATIGVLEGQLRDTETSLAEMVRIQGALEKLEGQVQFAQREYETFELSLQRDRIARTIESEKVAIVGVLEYPTYQIKARGASLFMVVAAVLAAVTGGIGMAFLRERLDHTVRTPSDLSVRLGLDCLSSLPPVRIRLVRTRLRREMRRRELRSDSVEPIPLTLAGHVITWMYFSDSVRRSFEELRSRVELLMQRAEKRPFVLAVTSCYRGEGVSAFATGLAYCVAFVEGEQVLLLNVNGHGSDGDRVPVSLKPPNLTELDVDRRMIEPPRMDPRVFHSKRADGRSPSPEGVKSFGDLFSSAKTAEYKLIVLDLPALSEGAIAAARAARADGVVLIVQSERVRREVVQAGLWRLQDAGANVLGAVLNRRQYYVPAWLYPVA